MELILSLAFAISSFLIGRLYLEREAYRGIIEQGLASFPEAAAVIHGEQSFWGSLFGHRSRETVAPPEAKVGATGVNSVVQNAGSTNRHSAGGAVHNGQPDSDGSVDPADAVWSPIVPGTGQAGPKPVLPKIASASKKKTEVSLMDSFKTAMESDNPYLAFGAARMQKLTLEEVQQCLEMMGSLEWGPQANQMLLGLMAQWGSLDPSSAMQYASQIDSRRTRSEMMSSIVGAWAKTDPSGALAWLMENSAKDRSLATAGLAPVFRTLAAKDPAMALAQLWSLPDAAMKKTALRSVMMTLQQSQNADMLVGVYGQMVPGPDRTMLAESLIESWSRYEPEKAAAWILQNSTTPQEQSRTISRLMTYWGYDRPDQAADWLAQLPANDIRRAEMGRLAQTWAQDDLLAAAAWVRQYPPSAQMDPAIQNIAIAFSRKDGAAGIAWAQTITDVKLRQRTVQMVALEWSKYNPIAAKPYLVPAATKGLAAR